MPSSSTTASNDPGPFRPGTRRKTPANEQLAQLELEIARLFLAYGKTAVARRRLKRIADLCGDSPTGTECRQLLAALDNPTQAGPDERAPVRRLASA
jgi:hypothetical protein